MNGDPRYQIAYSSGMAFLNPHDPDLWLLRLAKRLHCGATVLEIGCSEGFEASALAQLGLEVIAIDASPWAIRRAQEAHGNSRVRFQVGLWPDDRSTLGKSFDLVVDIGCLHTVEVSLERERYLKAVGDALTPKGQFYFRMGTDELTANANSVRRRPPSLPVWWELPTGETLVLPAPARGWRPSQHELEAVFADAGLRILNFSLVRGITYPWEYAGIEVREPFSESGV